MKTNKWIHIAITVGLALVGLVLGLVDALSYGVGYRDESVQTVFLESEEDIRAMGDSFYNNICYLENDITVSDLSVLADSRHPFVGVFDGQGHTITLTGDAAVKSLLAISEKGELSKISASMWKRQASPRVRRVPPSPWKTQDALKTAVSR